jgi:hypothetical protein
VLAAAGGGGGPPEAAPGPCSSNAAGAAAAMGEGKGLVTTACSAKGSARQGCWSPAAWQACGSHPGSDEMVPHVPWSCAHSNCSG